MINNVQNYIDGQNNDKIHYGQSLRLSLDVNIKKVDYFNKNNLSSPYWMDSDETITDVNAAILGELLDIMGDIVDISLTYDFSENTDLNRIAPLFFDKFIKDFEDLIKTMDLSKPTTDRNAYQEFWTKFDVLATNWDPNWHGVWQRRIGEAQKNQIDLKTFLNKKLDDKNNANIFLSKGLFEDLKNNSIKNNDKDFLALIWRSLFMEKSGYSEDDNEFETQMIPKILNVVLNFDTMENNKALLKISTSENIYFGENVDDPGSLDGYWRMIPKETTPIEISVIINLMDY